MAKKPYFDPSRFNNPRKRYLYAAQIIKECLFVVPPDGDGAPIWKSLQVTPVRDMLLLVYECFAAAGNHSYEQPPRVLTNISADITVECSRCEFLTWMIYGIDLCLKGQKPTDVYEHSWIRDVRQNGDRLELDLRGRVSQLDKSDDLSSLKEWFKGFENPQKRLVRTDAEDVWRLCFSLAQQP